MVDFIMIIMLLAFAGWLLNDPISATIFCLIVGSIIYFGMKDFEASGETSNIENQIVNEEIYSNYVK